MKVATLLLSASIALAAPLTTISYSGDSTRLQKPVVVAGSKHSHFFTDELSLKEQEQQQQAQDEQERVHFDNRPFSPSETESSSDVLSKPRPLPTQYLQSLSTPSSASENQRSGSKDVPVLEITKEEISELSSAMRSSIVEMETAASRSPRRPCHSGGPAHPSTVKPRMDLLVIGVFASFMAVVFLIETWSLICASARRIFRREGAIRLEETHQSDKLLSISTEDSIATPSPTPSASLSEKPTGS